MIQSNEDRIVKSLETIAECLVKSNEMAEEALKKSNQLYEANMAMIREKRGYSKKDVDELLNSELQTPDSNTPINECEDEEEEDEDMPF